MRTSGEYEYPPQHPPDGYVSQAEWDMQQSEMCIENLRPLIALFGRLRVDYDGAEGAVIVEFRVPPLEPEATWHDDRGDPYFLPPDARQDFRNELADELRRACTAVLSDLARRKEL